MTTLRSAIHRCVAGYSIEITPRQAARIASFQDLEGLGPGRRVNVVCLPALAAEDDGRGGNAFAASLKSSVATCERLRLEAGAAPVAHVPVRAFPCLGAAGEHLQRLRDAGVEDVLVLAGDAPPAASEDRPVGGDGGRGWGGGGGGGGGAGRALVLHETMQLLESGLLCELGFRSVGVAAHPEGLEGVTDPELQDAVLRKAAWGWDPCSSSSSSDLSPLGTALESAGAMVPRLYFTTQLCFSGEPLVAWEVATRRRLLRHLSANAGTGKRLRLPLPSVRVGLAGPAKLEDLVRFSERSRVGAASLRLLRRRVDHQKQPPPPPPPPPLHRQGQAGAGVVVPRDGVVAAVAEHMMAASSDRCLFDGLHFYCFGGFRETLRWASAIERGDFEVQGP